MRVSNVVHAVDTHACGEPGRVIVGGVLDVPGNTMFEKMQYLEAEADELRLRMLREPRGYPAANCNLILPPTVPEADAGYVIMEQVEYPGMSGTNTIAVVTVLIETGMVKSQEPVTELLLESPAGLIPVRAEVHNGKVKNVTFENVPGFAVYIDAKVEVPELGSVTVDVAYGGMFYVIADADQFGLRLTEDEAGDAVRVGEMVKAAAQEQLDCVHPENPDIRGITIGQLSAPPIGANADCRNTVVVSTGKLDWDRPSTWKGILDRSPCGTGTCAKMAAGLGNRVDRLVAQLMAKLLHFLRRQFPQVLRCMHPIQQWCVRHAMPPLHGAIDIALLFISRLSAVDKLHQLLERAKAFCSNHVDRIVVNLLK